MNAYDRIYLEDAMNNFAAMLDCGTQALDGNINDFYNRLIASGVAAQFEKGNPRYLSGMSGGELAYAVIVNTGGRQRGISYELGERTPEFWTGWALAYLQWSTGYSFERIRHSGLDVGTVMSMYPEYHEADLSKFVDTAVRIMTAAEATSVTPLKRQRKLSGLTQLQLAESSGVSLRMIQAYEQRYQDISKAEARTILNLSSVLGCAPEVLLR